MRTVMVFAGVALLTSFQWLVFIFGGFLIATGVKMLIRKDERPHPEDSRLLKLVKKVLPVSDDFHGGKLFVRVAGALTATPLFLALVAIEASDAVFAIDSIFAIFAVTTDPFIVLTSNIFAILGLRSLYFVLSGAAARFRYVQPGLALVLVFVGVKMVIAEWVKIPVLLSLAVIAPWSAAPSRRPSSATRASVIEARPRHLGLEKSRPTKHDGGHELNLFLLVRDRGCCCSRSPDVGGRWRTPPKLTTPPKSAPSSVARSQLHPPGSR